MQQTKVAVLTWHAYNLFGNTYETNDLIAFAHDLQTIREASFTVVPLSQVARWVRGEIETLCSDDKPVVALTCDDGTDYDFLDLRHPEHGAQRAFATTLRDANADGFSAHLTSFVIASPSARAQIANGAMGGQDALNDHWWHDATDSGSLSIESHGWDHNHPTVSPVIQREQRSGDFTLIDTFADCDVHVRASANFIESKTGRRPNLFAYPWTQASVYMRSEYMPQFAEKHGTIAAFGGQSNYITKDSDRWLLPRFVFGPDWRSKDGLLKILRGSFS
jgi:hypothetical protein